MASEDKDSGAHITPGAVRVLGRLKEAIRTAHEEKADVLVARANTPAAMKVVALLAMEAAEHQFASPRSRRNWDLAVDCIERAQAAIVKEVQARMGPAAAAILLAKLVAAVCRSNNLSQDKMLRLFRHFLAPPGADGHLPLDQVLELGATFSFADPEGLAGDEG